VTPVDRQDDTLQPSACSSAQQRQRLLGGFLHIPRRVDAENGRLLIRRRERGSQLGPQLDPCIRNNTLLPSAPLESRDQGGIVGVTQHDVEVGPKPVR
jgi:hypothetical protein